MVLRGQIQGFVYKGFPEVRAGQLQTNFEPRAAQPILIRVVHIEHEVECAASHAEAGHVDFLERDLGLLEGQSVSQRRACRYGDAKDSERRTSGGWSHNR